MSDDIVPDTKNWTWVLQMRCEDCGFDASAFDATGSGAAIRDLAVRWQAVLERPDAAARTQPDRWSALEYGCHVRDVFALFDQRLALMLTEDAPHFANWDQDQTAIEQDYGSQRPAIVASELSTAAALLADRFDAIAPDQWDRTGLRSDGSAFTVQTLAQYLMHDPVHHLWDVQAEVPIYV